MNHRTVPAPLLLASAIALLLSGCSLLPEPLPTSDPDSSSSAPPTPAESPTPSPAPSSEPEPDPSAASKPDLADLHLTTEGLGSLRIGSPVTASGMAEYDPDFCAGVSENPGDPADGRWVSTYGDDTFGIAVTAEDLVSSIGVRQADLRTPGGIGVGSTTDELTAAHPEATQAPSSVGLTDVWVLRGPSGQTVFEVANDSQPGYFEPDELGTVITLRTSEPGLGEQSTWGSDAGEGSCL
jgi:hypothetical protein